MSAEWAFGFSGRDPRDGLASAPRSCGSAAVAVAPGEALVRGLRPGHAPSPGRPHGVLRYEPLRPAGGRGRQVLLVDHHDSFTFNLVQAFLELGVPVEVVSADAIELDTLESLEGSHLVLSPGPGRPEDAHLAVALGRRALADRWERPVLGVCLGHQALCYAAGARIERLEAPVHGKVSSIHHDARGLFEGLPQPFPAMRYHSLTVAPSSLPRDLIATAQTSDGVLMAVAHRDLPLFGVQFHPESVGTPAGHQLLANFLRWDDAEFQVGALPEARS